VLKKEKMEEILIKSLEDYGWLSWQNKASMLFILKSKYGCLFDGDVASEIYDKIYTKKKEENEYT
jgi:hypothetical protein